MGLRYSFSGVFTDSWAQPIFAFSDEVVMGARSFSYASKTFIFHEETPIQNPKIPSSVWLLPGSFFGQSGNQPRPWSVRAHGINVW